MGITGEERDYAVDRVLDGASRWVENVLGRRFYTTAADETRYFTSVYYWQLCPPDDILSVTMLSTDNSGLGLYETTWTAGVDYYLGPANAIADGMPYTEINRLSNTGRFSFPAYRDGVRVTGKFGYCTIDNCPPGIRDLTMMVAESTGQSVLDLAMPGVQNYKLGNELTVTVSGRNLPPIARLLIDQFKRGSRFIN